MKRLATIIIAGALLSAPILASASLFGTGACLYLGGHKIYCMPSFYNR